MTRILGILSLALACLLLAGCGGGGDGDSDELTDDETERVFEASTKVRCADSSSPSNVSDSEREAAAEDLANIYKDKPDASYKNPNFKDEEALEDILREYQADLEDCDPIEDPGALAAAGELGNARNEVARED